MVQTKNSTVLFLRNWVFRDLGIVLFCLFLLGIVWSLAFWQVTRDKQSTIETVMNEGDKFSRAFEEHVRRVLRTNDQYITLMKTEYEGTHTITPSLQRLLSLLAQDPLVNQLALVDSQGKAMASIFPYPSEITFSHLPHFQAHITTDDSRLFIGKPFIGRVSNKPSIPISRRLDNLDSSFAGIVYTTLNTEYFTQFYQDMNFDKYYVVRVVGLDGVVRASNATNELGINIVESTLFQEMEGAPAGFYHSLGEISGKPCLMNYRVMPDYPLVVQVGMMEEALYPLQQRRLFYLGGAGGVSLFIVFYTGGLLVRSRRQRKVEAELRLSEEKYFKAFHLSPDSVNITRICDGLCVDINDGFTRMSGFTREEAIGETTLKLNIWVDSKDRDNLVDELKRNGEVINLEVQFRRKAGNILYGLLSAKIIVVAGEECILTIVRDITERKESETNLGKSNQELEAAYEELTATEEELRQQFDEISNNWAMIEEKDATLWALFNNMHDAFALHEIICDEYGQPINYRYLAVNPAFVRLTGISEDKLIGHTVLEVMPNTEIYWIDTFGVVALTGKSQSFVNYAQELKRYYSVQAYSPQWGKFAVLAMDITEQKNHEELVRHLAYHDALTGLPNRLQHHDEMQKVLDHAALAHEKCAIMFLDLNDFKQINDSFGHAAGDEFLKEVASRLKSCLREEDAIARMGGDEFAVIIPNIQDMNDMNIITECIINTVKEPWSFCGNDFHIGTSIGIAIYPQDGEDGDTLLKCADMAMYMAKSRGDNEIYFYTADLQTAVLERISMENALHQTLARKEFVLHYQPQVDIDGHLIGVEALLRWQHPTRGLLYPGDFLDLAEKAGLMVPIGEWVLRTACAQSVAWQVAGYPPITMAVNISATQFQSQIFLEMVSLALTETGLSPGLLELEITETVAMTNAELTTEITNSLQSMGIRQALDDFGTGYSSLKYLKMFKIDTLKIDKSFIQDVIGDPDSDAIVKAIIALSHNLQLEVVAEGVETKEQWHYLKQLHCQKLQGYYFSRPVPPHEVVKLFKKVHII